MKIFFPLLLLLMMLIACTEQVPEDFVIQGTAGKCDPVSATVLCIANAKRQLALLKPSIGRTFCNDFVKNMRLSDSEKAKAFTKVLIDMWSRVKIPEIRPLGSPERSFGGVWRQEFIVPDAFENLGSQMLELSNEEDAKQRFKEFKLENEAQIFRNEMQTIIAKHEQ